MDKDSIPLQTDYKGKSRKRGADLDFSRSTDHRNNPYVRDLNDLGGTSNAITSCEIISEMKNICDFCFAVIECFKETLNLSNGKYEFTKRSRQRTFSTEVAGKIRQHFQQMESCTQRLAFYLVDGLEARLVGIGRHHTTFANQTIIDAAKGKSKIEDLNIEEDEFLIINCMYRMKNLGDETVAMNSARDKVLKIMRRMNPHVFILGIVNGSYSSPFFITRFKEVMFHYSSLFDMLDANVPRDDEARKMLERGLFARDALNIIACEGAERTERPEAYKQWQVRCLKAGFEQLPVDPAVLNLILNMKKKMYHEDFVADEDSGWLLQGWKGRVIHAISKWKPNESYTDP
ncbi:hypothetical protein PR202_ga10975 [Eleusine coracana subsp. coracana]|uniref:Uncharacterized protein n=1 Tax=Eleusine coracana subsp. coracana TaxID=191504 RepID=A0AAV5C8E0_ELECO|nr:hypothetical protein PR202_ga10975 [Eleusine coracana subsp. coracana]